MSDMVRVDSWHEYVIGATLIFGCVAVLAGIGVIIFCFFIWGE